jgi:hypothetical protein
MTEGQFLERVLKKFFPSANPERFRRDEADCRRNAWKAFRGDPTKSQPKRCGFDRKGTFSIPSKTKRGEKDEEERDARCGSDAKQQQ